MKTLIRIMAVLILFSLALSAEAQIKVDFKKKIEQQVNRRLNQKTDQAIDKVLDTAEDSIAAGLKKDGSAGAAAAGQGTTDAQGNSDQKAGEQSGHSATDLTAELLQI